MPYNVKNWGPKRPAVNTLSPFSMVSPFPRFYAELNSILFESSTFAEAMEAVRIANQ
jgi:hypothetical protein